MQRSSGVYDETSWHMIARVLKMSGQSLGIGVSGCSSTGARMRVHFRIKIRHALGTPLPCLGLRISETRLPHLSVLSGKVRDAGFRPRGLPGFAVEK